MGEVSAAVLAVAALALFLLSSTQVAYRVRERKLGGLAGRLLVSELDAIPTRLIGVVAPLIAAASQLPAAYVLVFREHELTLLASVALLLELYAAAGWMAHLAEARRHLREALARYEEQKQLARMMSGYRR